MWHPIQTYRELWAYVERHDCVLEMRPMPTSEPILCIMHQAAPTIKDQAERDNVLPRGTRVCVLPSRN